MTQPKPPPVPPKPHRHRKRSRRPNDNRHVWVRVPTTEGGISLQPSAFKPQPSRRTPSTCLRCHTQTLFPRALERALCLGPAEAFAGQAGYLSFVPLG